MTTYGPPKGYVAPPTNDTNAFDGFLAGYKTYIAAALGIAFNVLAAFHVWSPTPEQVTAVNGVAVLGTAIFLRLGVRKAQKAAQGARAAVEKAQ